MYRSGLGYSTLIFGSVILPLLGIVSYIFLSIGLMTMAKNKGINKPWLAWIPIANLYIFVKVLCQDNIFGIEISKLSIILPVATIASYILRFIPIIGYLSILINIAIVILIYIILFKFYKIVDTDKGVLFFVLSVLVFPLIGIFIFILRNNTAISESGGFEAKYYD